MGAAHCRDTPKLTQQELETALQALPAWRLSEDNKSIIRSFVTKNFVKGLLSCSKCPRSKSGSLTLPTTLAYTLYPCSQISYTDAQ